VGARKGCRKRLADQGAAASRVAIGGDRNADPGAAYGDAAIGLTACDRFPKTGPNSG
jgi:hypothetical protein